MLAHSSELSLPIRRGVLGILGDTQRTHIFERAVGREQNDEERDRLVNGLIELAPDGLIHLGDMVARGNKESDWRRFDSYLDRLRRENIDVFPVFGNHDSLPRAGCLPHLHNRFSWLPPDARYVLQFGDVAFVIVDSNLRAVAAAERPSHAQWLDRTLERLDANPDVRAIVLCMHHPPLTNSTVTRDDPHVHSFFLPAFRQSKKTVALVAGHTHAYEHFLDPHESRRHFIVAGGGGGPRVNLRPPSTRPHHDLFEGASKRPFHFLTLNALEQRIEVQVHGFDKGHSQVELLDQFPIAYP